MCNGKIRIINSNKNLGPVAVFTQYYQLQSLKTLGNIKNYKEIFTNVNELIAQVKTATFLLSNYFLINILVTTNLLKALAEKILKTPKGLLHQKFVQSQQKYKKNQIADDETFGTADFESLYPSIDLQTIYKTLYNLTYQIQS
ncbi:hypothetical protein BB561_006579 [Smittium simulii]|uniref:Uncharacterized protein n=1 Tax=Smittium simulii TaxID=133385 RepID=A0A2T9Y309_9FUNG|nr:hypothetical protein BB561_006579 [Smittium simulii]